MSYMHIDNLYKSQEILLFKKCYAMEKIHGCVKKGTLITLSNGEKIPIEKIKRGFSVLTYNIDKEEFTSGVVENLIIQHKIKSLSWFELSMDNGSILICTEDHPILTKNRGWVIAKELQPTDNIVSAI